MGFEKLNQLVVSGTVEGGKILATVLENGSIKWVHIECVIPIEAKLFGIVDDLSGWND